MSSPRRAVCNVLSRFDRLCRWRYRLAASLIVVMLVCGQFVHGGTAQASATASLPVPPATADLLRGFIVDEEVSAAQQATGSDLVAMVARQSVEVEVKASGVGGVAQAVVRPEHGVRPGEALAGIRDRLVQNSGYLPSQGQEWATDAVTLAKRDGEASSLVLARVQGDHVVVTVVSGIGVVPMIDEAHRLDALTASRLGGPAEDLMVLRSPLLQAAPFCPEGQQPMFVLGFASLKAQIGAVMGEPLECEHANPENGDSLQQTTTGLSFYRKSTNTATFTNGWEHWGLTAAGLVYWTGDSIDPPGTIVPVVSPPNTPRIDPVPLLPTSTPMPRPPVPQPTATPTPRPPAPTPTPIPPTATPTRQQSDGGCCRRCTTGKACGDSCINRSYTCHVGAGCACNAIVPSIDELVAAYGPYQLMAMEALEQVPTPSGTCTSDQEDQTRLGSRSAVAMAY